LDGISPTLPGFHDSTLEAMVQHRPATLAEFSQLFGVSKRKSERYGQAFLAVLEAHLK